MTHDDVPPVGVSPAHYIARTLGLDLPLSDWRIGSSRQGNAAHVHDALAELATGHPALRRQIDMVWWTLNEWGAARGAQTAEDRRVRQSADNEKYAATAEAALQAAMHEREARALARVIERLSDHLASELSG